MMRTGTNLLGRTQARMTLRANTCASSSGVSTLMACCRHRTRSTAAHPSLTYCCCCARVPVCCVVARFGWHAHIGARRLPRALLDPRFHTFMRPFHGENLVLSKWNKLMRARWFGCFACNCTALHRHRFGTLWPRPELPYITALRFQLLWRAWFLECETHFRRHLFVPPPTGENGLSLRSVRIPVMIRDHYVHCFVADISYFSSFLYPISLILLLQS